LLRQTELFEVVAFNDTPLLKNIGVIPFPHFTSFVRLIYMLYTKSELLRRAELFEIVAFNDKVPS